MHALHFSASDKAALYREVLPQIESVVADETDWVANLANTAAVLKEAFGWFWVGFYLVDTRSDELVLAPFQGPLACTRIPFGRGVCGQAWAKGGTVVVGDVDAHPDHIACSSLVAFGDCRAAVFRRPLYRRVGRGQRTFGAV